MGARRVPLWALISISKMPRTLDQFSEIMNQNPTIANKNLPDLVLTAAKTGEIRNALAILRWLLLHCLVVMDRAFDGLPGFASAILDTGADSLLHV